MLSLIIFLSAIWL